MKLSSYLYPARWFLLFVSIIAGFLFYADYTGWRLLTFSSQEEWTAAGPGGHK